MVTSLCLGLLNSYPLDNVVMNMRLVVNEHIDKASLWGYFDGSVAGMPQICGDGGILYISDEHFSHFLLDWGWVLINLLSS